MRELVNHALDMANLKRADYADIRVARRQFEEIAVKNGKLNALTRDEDMGFGIRVLFQGAWGFACSSKVARKEMERAFNQAWKMARESSRVKDKKVLLAPRPPTVARYQTPLSIDPWRVTPDRKIRLLLESDEILRRNQRVKISEAFMGSYLAEKAFASTEGTFIEQKIVECGAGISATAIEGGQVQVRSYPNSFRGNFATGGYEWVEGLKLRDQAERIAEEAAQLLSAKPCPSGITTVILDGAQLALQVHESIGHPIELDRILGSEASYAGTSFLNLSMVGNFQYASPGVNVVGDATVAGGLGTFGYDDEGTRAQQIPILTQGRLTGLLTSRETAPLLGQESNGTMRADGWNRLPLIRMTNINLEPGEWKLEEMIADTEEGLLLSTNRSWSIDDRRINFQFGTEIGWEIRKGKLGAVVRNPTYTGMTPDFWNSCDAVADRNYWQMWGTPNCGKGEPGQVAHVGHGVAPARFRNVRVGVMK
jgi:TldD protein